MNSTDRPLSDSTTGTTSGSTGTTSGTTDSTTGTTSGSAGGTGGRPLRRSRRDRKVAGVCGGIAEHFGWDPTVVRLVFILSILLPGPQVLAYLLAWLVMPEEDDVG
jgi:phage shock protein C